MGKCVYTYKGKEYSDYNSLKEDIEKGQSTTTFNLTGNLELQESIIKSEAIATHGTAEHITFVNNNNILSVTIDESAIKGLTSNEMLLRNKATGMMESVNLDNVSENTHDDVFNAKVERIADRMIDGVINTEIPRVLNEMKGNESLKNKLVNFAERLGVKFETLEGYLKSKIDREQLEDIDDVKALADVFEKTIALAEDSTLEDLVEEVSHFAIEVNMDNPVMEKMIDKVDQTEDYKKHAKTYREKYKGDERKTRIEILGKILARKINDDFNSENTNSIAEKGIISQLKELWNNFINKFKDIPFIEEFGNVLDSIASDVLSENKSPITLSNSKQIYFSIKNNGGVQKDIQDTLENIISNLQSQYKIINLNNKIQDQKTRTVIKEIRERLANYKYVSSINAAVNLIAGDIQYAERIINKTKGDLSKELNETDILQLLAFITNVKSTLSSLTVSINHLAEIGVLDTTEENSKILKLKMIGEINSVSSRADSVIRSLRPFIANRSVEIVEEQLDEYGIQDKETRTYFLNPVLNNTYEEVGMLSKATASFRKMGNPIFKVLNFMLTKANSKLDRALRKFQTGLREILNKTGLEGSSLLQNITKYGTNINPFDILKVEEYIKEQTDIIEAEYDTKIEEAKTEKEKEILRKEKKLAVSEKRFSYVTKRTTSDYQDRMKALNLSEDTRAEIRARSNEKFKILNKYRKKDGTIDYNITTKDMIELEAIDAVYKYNLSEYESNGDRKEGVLLTLAQELKKYRESFIKQDEELEISRFEADKSKVLADIRRKQNITTEEAYKTKEFAFWARNNARYDYDPAIRAKLNEQGSNVKTISLKKGYDANNIIIGIGRDGIDLENATQEQLLEIYETLTNKRKEIISQYRKDGEVDTELFNKDEVMVETINHLNDLISNFKVDMTISEQGQEYQIRTRGNKYFYQKLAELEKSPREKNAFLKLTGAIEDKDNSTLNNKAYVPTLYQYKSYYLVDKNGEEVGKKYIPNYKYNLKTTEDAELNPNYVPELAGKVVQYDLNHPELQEFVLQEDFYNFFGIDRKNDPYGLKNGATRNKGVWEVRQYLLDSKQEIDSKVYVEQNRYFYLPQVVATGKELLNKGLKKSASAFVEKSFLDISGNEEESVGTSERIVIPKRYNRQLTSQEILTTDIGRMYGEFYGHGIKYREQNKILPDILVLVDNIKNGSLTNGGEVAQSRMYAALKNHLSTHLYGNLLTETEGITNALRMIPGMSKRVSGAKVLNTLATYVSKSNLGFSVFTPVVGGISGMMDNMKLYMADDIVDKGSYGYALKEASKLIASYVTDTASSKPTTRGKKLMEYFPLNISNRELLDGITKSKTYRAVTDPTMVAYELVGTASALQASISATHAHRLMSDGKFHNINSWREANKGRDRNEVDNEFKNAKNKSYYKYINTDGVKVRIDREAIKKDGFKGDIESFELYMMDVVEKYWAKIENQATALDKPQMNTNPYLKFAGIHSQWLFNFIHNRFMQKQFMEDSMRWEEGSYVSIFKNFINVLKNQDTSYVDKALTIGNILGSVATLGWHQKGMEGLEEYEQLNLKRFGADIYGFLMLFSAMVLMNLAADDDEDDPVMQYLAYISTRALTEQSAAVFPFALRDMGRKLKEPVVGFNYIETLYNIPILAMSEKGSEEVTRGDFKGMSKRGKALLQMTMFKNLAAPIQGAEAYRTKNNFIMSSGIQTEKAWYEAIKGYIEE